MKVITQKNNQDHVPCSFAYKIVCIDDRFTKSIVVLKMHLMNLLKSISIYQKSNEQTL